VSSTTQNRAVQHQDFTFVTYTDSNNRWYANENDFYYIIGP
jgi:hypothetical protein